MTASAFSPNTETVAPVAQLEAVVGAMLASGCSDAQIGAVCRVIGGSMGTSRGGGAGDGSEATNGGNVKRSFTPAKSGVHSGVGLSPQRSQFETVGETVGATVSRPAATVSAPLGDPRLMRAALMRVRDMPVSARRVGEVIIDHYNRRSGRCDPSIGRIASVSGLSRATVFRALSVLCGAGGLFVRHSYGGHSHCNQYQPDWARAAAVAAELAGAEPSQRSQQPSQIETQTLSPNTITSLTRGEVSEADSHARMERTMAGDAYRAGAKRPVAARKTKPPRPDPRQPQMLLPSAGGRSVTPSSAHVADVSAHKRLIVDFRRHYDGSAGYAAREIAAMNHSGWAEAVQAERAKPGKGLGVLLTAMLRQDAAPLAGERTGTDPPL